MHPSESNRHLCLYLSDPYVIEIPFFIIGVIAVIAATVLLVLFHGQTLTAHGTVNGEPAVTQISSLIVCGIIYAFGLLFIAVARLFVRGIGRIICKVPPYPVKTEERISKNELLARADEELTAAHPQWDVTVNGNWIDITWNWENAISADFPDRLKLFRNVSTFSKFIEINDDYTYHELDMRRNCSFGGEKGGISYHKSIAIGHMTGFTVKFNPGIDLNGDKKPGIQTYQMSTDMISDPVHEWLAGYGYTYRVSALNRKTEE